MGHIRIIYYFKLLNLGKSKVNICGVVRDNFYIHYINQQRICCSEALSTGET